MREAAFRTYLAPLLSPTSIESYVDYCERVERDLGIDLDRVGLDEHGIETLRTSLDARGVVPKSVGNCVSALRRYGEMRAAG